MISRRLGFLFQARWVLRGALIVVAVFCYVRGVGYSSAFQLEPEDIPMGISLVSTFVPLWVWSLLWFGAALLALASVPKAWPGGSLGCALLSFVWATGFAVSWAMTIEGFHVSWYHHVPIPNFITDGSPSERDYLSSSIYWTVLLLLGAGYILARKAIDASAVIHTVDER